MAGSTLDDALELLPEAWHDDIENDARSQGASIVYAAGPAGLRTETIVRVQFRLIGCRFAYDAESGLWLVEDLYPGFDLAGVPAVLEQLTYVWDALEPLFAQALLGEIPGEDALDAAFDLEAASLPN